MKLLTERYENKISLSLGCYDRLILTGTLPEISYAQGMTSYMYKHNVHIFDYSNFAEPFKERIREHIETLAQKENLRMEFVRKSNTCKEDIISEKLKERGDMKQGVVHILSDMEQYNIYKPWHNKQTGHTFLNPEIGKCLHYYVYFIDLQLGLGYVRIPTWCPFRLQVYINGHNLLASQLREAGIEYTMIDNAFDSISNPDKAQELSDSFSVETIHRKLDELAWLYCPVYKELNLRYHWSVMQAEYATDIVFKKQKDLEEIYSDLISTAIHAVEPDNIATFLGRKLDDRYQGEVGNNYHVRIQGSRIKHSMGAVSIKMYDKFNKILRIETTANDMSFFKHFREVVHRDGTTSYQNAPLKKNIYSLGFLTDNLKAANARYLEFISTFEDKHIAHKRLEKVTVSKEVNSRNYKGFNFFSKDDLKILFAILRGEFNINGFRNKNLQKILNFTSGKISRIIKRLRVHGIIKKATDSYKYYLTPLGKETIVTAQKIKEMVIIPAYQF